MSVKVQDIGLETEPVVYIIIYINIVKYS